MVDLPSASNTIAAGASVAVGGDDLLIVIAPVPLTDDAKPRLFGSAAALMALHGYCEAVEFLALYADQTRKPILFCGVPIVTAGAISNEVTTGSSGSSTTTITAGADGVLCEHDGVLRVVTGGTIGTSQIVLELSLDGGRTFKRVRLGTANRYTLPYVGAMVAFGVGELIAGETIHTWHGSGPRADSDGWTDAFNALAAQQKLSLRALALGDVQTDTEAAALLALATSYDTGRRRFLRVRAGVLDKSSAQTKAEWMAAIDTEFDTIDDNHRITLSAGKGRIFSPFSRWYLRWPVAWAAAIREAQHDLHIPAWRKSDGPTGAILHDADGNLVEWDDEVDGAAGSAARFETYRTWANGPAGAFIAQSPTRASDSSLLVHAHNTDVVNRARTVCQAATEHAIGKSLILKPDGTATADSISEIESFVRTSLANDLLADKRGEGPRVSNVTWTMASDDVLNVPVAIVNGTLTISIRGTIHTINTQTVVR